MNIIKFYDDYNIQYQTEGHKHCREGWVNIPCPFCSGNQGLHLGYDINNDFFVCWRCGWHPNKKVVAKLTGATEQKAKEIIKKYGGKTKRKRKPEPAIKIGANMHKEPPGVSPFSQRQHAYLEKRGFNSASLEKTWDLKATGPMSILDGVNYSHRIFIPFYWEGKQVSYQTRDITEKSKFRYLACPEKRELIKHKHILYRHPEAENDFCICVEGVTDVWRLGKIAVATLGIKYTPEQLKLLAEYKRVVVLFDDDPQAIRQADKLVKELRFRGTSAKSITLIGDPGSMSQEEADNFIINTV